MKSEQPIKCAIKMFGSQKRLAQACGVTQQAVSQWNCGSKISVECALVVERATNGQIKSSELRPDIFPPIKNLPSAKQAVISYIETQTDNKNEYETIVERDADKLLKRIGQYTGLSINDARQVIITDWLKRIVEEETNIKPDKLSITDLNLDNSVVLESVSKWIHKLLQRRVLM